MHKRPYEAPRVFELGTIKELTESTPERDKCSGSEDNAYPQDISPIFSGDCP